MTPELGQFLLALALVLAVIQAGAPLVGFARNDALLLSTARPLALVQLALLAGAFALLTLAHAQSDFSVLNVYENSHTAKPFIYKLSGVWGNHEGSILLWSLVLAVFGAALAANKTADRSLLSVTLAIQGSIAAAFLAYTIFTSNPFDRLFPAPADGMDLNPLLQDPGLAIHPPFLYLGYVGFSIAFAFAVAGLITGKVDEDWAKAMRPWALIAWVFLTIGIGLGSWWAYYELGWGGFWAWDPVENASFMPWLAGTALIHSVRVVEKRGALKVWTVLLAIAAFSLSLIGTFLVRSGIITSVHAFAVDPTRGVFILMILGLVIGGSLLVFALRAPRLTAGGAFAPVSREGSILLNNILMTAACGTVFIGTFYPLIYEMTAGTKLSVGAPYFNATFMPLMALLLLVTAPAASLTWKKGDPGAAFKRVWPAALIALFGAVLALYFTWPKQTAAALGAGLAIWAGGGVILDVVKRAKVSKHGLSKIGQLPRSYLGMAVSHFGVAVLAIGVLGAGVWRDEVIQYMKPGAEISVGGYELHLEEVRQLEGPNYISEQAAFSVRRDGRALAPLEAERRYYPVRGMQTTEAGVATRPMGDLYITIGAENADHGHAVRAWYNPFAVWLWIGSGLIAFGGLVAMSPKRKPAPSIDPKPVLAKEAA